MNINKFKPCRYSGKPPKGLEATIKGGGEHKEDLEHKDLENKDDSQKCFRYASTKNRNQPK
jgi:hypothetical protein